MGEQADKPRFGFVPPPPLVGSNFHLEVLGPDHNERDHEAWSSSMEHIHATPGFEDHPWPHEMTRAENLADMAMHAREFEERTGFTYSILDDDAVIGCVYVYPPDQPADGDARVRSWVRASRAADDGPIRAELHAWLLSPAWPFESIRFPG